VSRRAARRVDTRALPLRRTHAAGDMPARLLGRVTERASPSLLPLAARCSVRLPSRPKRLAAVPMGRGLAVGLGQAVREGRRQASLGRRVTDWVATQDHERDQPPDRVLAITADAGELPN
jgi:hypothetical protein